MTSLPISRPARLLVAAKGPGRLSVIVGVDAERAGLDLTRKRMCDFQVLRTDARLESAFRAVGNSRRSSAQFDGQIVDRIEANPLTYWS